MATVRMTFALDSERDAALIAWLEAQANRSEAIRAALTQAAATREVTLADVLAAIEALGQRLAGLQVSQAEGRLVVQEDPDLAAALDSLGLEWSEG